MTATLIDSAFNLEESAAFTSIDTIDDFMTRYQTELYGFALHVTRNRTEADDLYQETLIKALSAFDGHDGAISHRAWLYKIAISTFLNRRRWPDSEGRFNRNVMTSQAGHLASLDGGDLVSEVEAGMDRLPAKQRIALVLRKYQGLGYDEIAASLDTSESRAREDVYQALRTLRERLDSHIKAAGEDSGDEMTSVA